MTDTATLDASIDVSYFGQVGVVDAGGGSYVLKQPHPNIRVEDDWPADVPRVHNEAAAARAYTKDIERIGIDVERTGIDDVVVPEVVFESYEDNTIILMCVPDDATMWKRDLLAGRVDRAVAASLGRSLGTTHRLAPELDGVRQSFRDETPFDQLRVDPCHRTTADRHPELAEPILAEAERVLAADRTLVHGDYSPKTSSSPTTCGPSTSRSPTEATRRSTSRSCSTTCSSVRSTSPTRDRSSVGRRWRSGGGTTGRSSGTSRPRRSSNSR